MKRTVLPAAFLLGLAACGDSQAGEEVLRDTAAVAIDEKALTDAVSQSIDRNALEGMARGAVTAAVEEAIPAEIRAAGTVIDEAALARGVDQAIDGDTLRTAAQEALAKTGVTAGTE